MRLGLVGLAGLSLLAGLWAGLVRIGWPLPTAEPAFAAAHAPLLVAGFLGVVIALERAVALGRSWAFAAPALAGLGGLGLAVAVPGVLAAGLVVLSSLVVVGIFARLYQLRPEWSSGVLMAGALAWVAGNVLWLRGQSLILAAPWWAGFLVLTIAGERLELAQVLLPGRRRLALLVAAGCLLAGLELSAIAFTTGIRVGGLGLLALAAWLLRYDVARRTVRRHGVSRFSALALLAGYVWLGVAGLLWVVGPEQLAQVFWYDAMLHSLFLGLGFSMIFGHAPTILPAVTGLGLRFERWFYVHLGLLHVSLVLRILSDVAVWPEVRRWAGVLNVTAILLFAVVTIAAIGRAGESSACGAMSSSR
jgi:hypothetical protein